MLLASRPRAVKEPLPDVPASAGAFVHAFQNPTDRRSFLFRTSARICPRRKENSSVGGNAGRGQAVRRLALSCPRLQAPAGNFDFSTA